MALLNRAIRNAGAMMRATEWGASSVIPPNSANALSAGGSPGYGIEAAALSISTVLSCVKALSDDTSTIPFAAYTGDPNGTRELLRVQPQIVTEPFGPDLDVHAGMAQLVVSRVMRGNAYLYVVARDANRLPTQVMVLHPDSVRAFTRGGVKRFKIGADEFGTDEIIHIPGLMMPGAVAGVDVLTAQRINLDLALKVTQYADGFFGSGGSPSGVISVPGPGDRKKAREVKEGWEANHGGVPNAHRPAVVFGGAKWTPLSVTPENAQFLETRKFLREEIAGLYGVPLSRIHAVVEKPSPAGPDTTDADYVKHGLLPNMAPIEATWARMLPGANTWCRFNLDVFLRANAETRAKVAQIHRVTGVRTPDEIRGDEGWAPLPDGKGTDPFTPLNSNASPTGGASNEPKPGGEPGPSQGGPA